MTDMLGFWSYVHKDDEVDFGRISQLARDIVANYEAIRGEPIHLFLDRDDLEWGDRWREKIDEALSNVAFFVPVLTPRYLDSVECRREFQFFYDRTQLLGIRGLVLPILYIDVPALDDAESTDAIVLAARERQWIPWIANRFEERDSGAYRRAVHDLASEIARRVQEIETADVVTAAEEAVASGLLSDEPGPLDRIAALEDAMPRWNEALEKISAEVQEIGDIVRRGGEEMNSDTTSGKGFAARLVVARRVAAQLDDPVTRIELLTRDWLKDLDSIDAGMRSLIDNIDQANEEDPEVTRNFLNSLRGLSLAANQGLGGALLMAAPIEKLATQSRDLRPVLRRLHASLLSMAEARATTDTWVELVEGTGLLQEGGEAAPSLE